MKRPLSDENMRWMMMHAPDSMTGSLCRASLDLRKAGREFIAMFVPCLAKIIPPFMEIKQSHRKYLKNAPNNRT